MNGGGTQPNRRGILLGVLVVASVVAFGVARRRSKELVYQDLPELAPFRELVSDGGISSISAASLVFVGIQDYPSEVNAQLEDRIAQVRGDPCVALFGAPVSPDVVPMAYFSDFNCPYCRVLEGVLATVLTDDAGVLVRHELPLLGADSEAAAKAVLAADLQGGYEAMKTKLLGTGLITDAPFLQAVAGPLGLDADQLLADMESSQVTDRLLTSIALGKVFGFFGTPALVIGRTVILGSVSPGTIQQVIGDERAMPILAC